MKKTPSKIFDMVLNTPPDSLFKSIEIQKRFANFNTTRNTLYLHSAY